MKTSLRLNAAAFVLTAFNVSAATLYVSLESTNPLVPYTTWVTAATNIQDAVDAARTGDTVLVTNGVYATGSREVSVLDPNQEPPRLMSMGMSRVVVTNSIRLESVNGPLLTSIEGSMMLDEWGNITNGVRCLFLGSNALLSGFTLTNGVAHDGAGVLAESPSAVVSNCTLTGNKGNFGGGAYGGTLYGCTLNLNWVGVYGGSKNVGAGAFNSILYNCILKNNSGSAAAIRCTLYNCILTDNNVGTLTLV